MGIQVPRFNKSSVRYLGTPGFKLRLHDIDDSRLSEIRVRGGVDVEGEEGGFAAVDLVTSNLGSAVDGADVIIVVTGGNAQAAVARSLAPLLQNGQVILLIQGNTAGSLIVRQALNNAGCRVDVDVAEMDNYPYSMLAARAYANTTDRPEAVAADRGVSGKQHLSGVSAPVALVSGSGRGAEYLVTPASPTPMRCCMSPIASPTRDASRAGTATNSMRKA
jgi:hypothetical protein